MPVSLGDFRATCLIRAADFQSNECGRTGAGPFQVPAASPPCAAGATHPNPRGSRYLSPAAAAAAGTAQPVAPQRCLRRYCCTFLSPGALTSSSSSAAPKPYLLSSDEASRPTHRLYPSFPGSGACPRAPPPTRLPPQEWRRRWWASSPAGGRPLRVWRSIVQKGDTVVDATCGNGNDTLALLKMVADERGQGRVYGMDIQDSAVESTSSFLKMAVDSHEMELVKLFPICHSRMDEIVPRDSPVRLVAFNLGYLPGGDKTIITVPKTTELALQAASRMVSSGGLISVLVYIGHPGGRDELSVVESFASSLPVDTWVCCKFEMLNRPIAPVLVFLHKK